MNSAAPLIRAATAADIPGVLALAHTTPNAPAWTAAHYAELLTAQHVFLVALVASNALAGFCVLSLAADAAELDSIVVSPNHQRQGIGRALSERALLWAKSNCAEQAFLEVRASNTGAITLYTTLGFRTTGRRRAYYSNPAEDAVLMRAAL